MPFETFDLEKQECHSPHAKASVVGEQSTLAERVFGEGRMYRIRVPLVASLVLAILTALLASNFFRSGQKVLNDAADHEVEHAQKGLPILDLLRGVELTNLTVALAREDEMGDALSKPTIDLKRQAGFAAVQARNARLESEGKRADLMLLVGLNGHVICRDLNIQALYDEELGDKYPSIKKAVTGYANKDMWKFDGQLYRVAAAPIRSRAGAVLGALVVGYVASAKDAASDREKIGTEVAYFFDGKVQASSFARESGESAEEKALAGFLFTGKKFGDRALHGEMTPRFELLLGTTHYLAAAGPLPGNITQTAAAYAVLSPLHNGPFATKTFWLVMFGIVAIVAVIATAVLTTMQFLVPLDAMERGVADVINGNRDHSFEAGSADFEGLANGLNVMVARLLGRPDPNEDDDGGAAGRWQGEVSVENSPAVPQPSAENVALAKEPEEKYLRRVFDEYVAARRSLNQSIEGLVYEEFIAKLRQNEASLRQKYNSSQVRFKVVIKEGQATLKPVPIV